MTMTAMLANSCELGVLIGMTGDHLQTLFKHCELTGELSVTYKLL